MNWKCKQCDELNDEKVHSVCWKCKESRFGHGDKAVAEIMGGEILCSTTPELPGRKIANSCGVVFGEAVLAPNVLSDLLAGMRDIIGGRSEAYERNLKDVRDVAMSEMLQQAISLEADAVVGIDIDYETVGQSMMMVCASGTAVKLMV